MTDHLHGGAHESLPRVKAKPPKLTREMLYLAEQAAEGELKALPGGEWALHYPAPEETRAEKLQGLLDGKYSADEVARDIKPDALIYDARDIESQGLEKVSARIRDLSAFIAHYDYPRFARFVESMRGREIPLADLDNLYREVTRSRTQKKVMDSYGYTGRKQIEEALRAEAAAAIEDFNHLPRAQKVLKTLKADWLSEDLGLVSAEERDRMVSELSGDERKAFEDLKEPYRQYVGRGDENAYKKLTAAMGFARLLITESTLI